MKKAQFILSQKDSPNLLAKQPALAFKPDAAGEENQLVNVYDDVMDQTLDGFGGAVTEAAAVTLQKLSPANQKKIIDAYYHPAKGIGYTLARAHINSSDFSCGNYAYVEQDGDFALKTFNIARDKEAIVPMLLRAQKTAGATINILGSPWSPPAWMKTTRRMNQGGKLRPECRDAWARYYAKFVKAYRAEGLNIWALTIQNEPKATQTWDSCIYTGEEERDFVRDFLGKTLRKEGLRDVEVYVWDHNKERLVERASVVMDDKAAAKFVRGAAFHWYSGSHFEAVGITHQKYPGL
ncbi:MAG: glucosylceramidase, partial [Kiritimatiellaeota bacterium]|nr:glucosylceramidase [Kiritimatiellota bacterium]